MRALLRVLAVLTLIGFAGGTARASGTVTVSYTLFHLFRLASNQVAVWIETDTGLYVKTLYASSFMAGRQGYKRRPQCAPEWVQAAGVSRMSQAELDAVSGATQKPGNVSVTWDCTDASGKPVPAGTFIYKVEGNIFFEKRVLWTGRIAIGGTRDSSSGRAVFIPPEAKDAGVLLADVSARYTPGP